LPTNKEERHLPAVMIGVDPHKGSHTAVALSHKEIALATLRVRASADQVERLVCWAGRWPERTWAVENASGLGYLLAQQLVAAGERALGVQPKLGARVRLLDNGSTNKNDPNDARSVAVAAMRAKGLPEVVKEDHAAVMRVWVRRRSQLTRHRTRVADSLHAVICELVAGGLPKEISVAKATRALEGFEPVGAVQAARKEFAWDLVEDLCQLDDKLKQVKERLMAVVAASRTTTTGIFGVGPVIAATALSITKDVRRFPSSGRFAAYNGTAPIEASSGPHKIYRLSRRGSRQLNHAVHMAAVTQVSHPRSEGRAYYDRKISEGMSPKSALRALKRRVSGAIYAAMVADARRDGLIEDDRGPGGQKGDGTVASVAGLAPPGPALRKSHSRARAQTTTPGPSRRGRRGARTRADQGSAG
jgi:transposase